MSDASAPYRSADIEDRLLTAIEAAGLDPMGGFGADALGALDHFHTGGRAATMELLQRVEIVPEHRVLDVGSGIGGPARLLASTTGCSVVCLELSEDFCRGARLLNRLTGLDGRIEVRQGSAIDPPFGDASFDLVWIQNVGMNIADKAHLYGQAARVLRPGGRLAFQEVAAGLAGELHFPLPWADGPSESFLIGPEEFRKVIESAGFVPELFEDSSDAELSRPSAGAAQGPLTVGVYVDNMATKSQNARRSLESGAVRLVRGVFRRR